MVARASRALPCASPCGGSLAVRVEGRQHPNRPNPKSDPNHNLPNHHRRRVCLFVCVCLIVYCGGRARSARPPACFALWGFACRSCRGAAASQSPKSQIGSKSQSATSMRLRWSCALRAPSRLLRFVGVRLPSACGGWAVGVRLCGFACVGSPEGAVTIFFFLAG